MTCFFFFSSRRRHTSSLRDWSSDVCSSDLGTLRQPGRQRLHVPAVRGQAQHSCLLGRGQIVGAEEMTRHHASWAWDVVVGAVAAGAMVAGVVVAGAVAGDMVAG